MYLICRLEFLSGINAQLADLLAVYQIPHPQDAAGDLHVGQTVSLAVPGDFEHAGAKFAGPGRRGCPFLQPLQKLLHPV